MTTMSSSVDLVWAFERDCVESVTVDFAFDYVNDEVMSNVQTLDDADAENEIDDARRIDFSVD